MTSPFLPTACPHDCPSTCALEVEQLAPDRIGKVRGAAANSYTAGVICAKVSRYAERVHSPDRLKTPLLRTGPKGAGQWKEIAWDEALDRIAEAFLAAERQYGAEAVWPHYYAGTMGLVQRGAIQRLRHAKGYSRQISTVCDTPANMGWLAGHGDIRGADPREMADSDLIVNWGGNPVATQVNVMTHVSRARKARGAKLVTIDPYRTGTAEVSDLHLMLRPGTDGALACAVMHVLFKEGFADRAYLDRYAADVAQLEAHLETRTPEWAAAITGLAAEEIVAFARLYGGTKRSYLRLGYGLTRAHNGAAQMHAVSCLPVVTGAWTQKGGGALYCSSGIYTIDRTLSEGLDRLDSSVRGFDQSRIGAVLTGDDIKDGPPVTAMLIQNTNPAVICPDSARVRRGFLRDDLFVAVHEQFMTDTARLADLVIPATTFLEHDDLYRGGGQMHILIGRKVIEPQHQARENHWVISEIARRVGAEHPGFGMTALEIIDSMLKASGLGDAATLTEQRWIDAQPDFETSHFLNGFAFPDGRFRFAPDWAALGPYGADVLPEMPDHMIPGRPTDAEHPFRLVTAPARQFLNSSFTETVTSQRREGRPSALIHPDDAAGLLLAEGDAVRVGNRQGSVIVHAKPFAGVPRGVVIVEGIWPNTAFVEGIGINTLTSAEPIPPGGGAAFHDTAVWLRAA
ncbi:molybdopterin-containing oxidoreductase family protein [Azospirillum canadense]|uniref:molybdopterin-containing oxidoreductase family protein n=1 Tax=Azospirillum canadense TaxID=403962 RepID=UPI0022267BD9|nr:molybdopterin oxidoreductase family protein [Azospirillum canadense]MCW2237307.1 anaerobic selenocysteine-containing dehydrogenase [Azospirillum canadense]